MADEMDMDIEILEEKITIQPFTSYLDSGMIDDSEAIEMRDKCLAHELNLGKEKPIIHWGLPQFPDLWDGKGMCGVECLPEHTSAGLAITCPECLRLFKEQNETSLDK